MSGTVTSITVAGYPANNLVPGVFFSIDASQANTAQVPQRALIIGQIAGTSTLTPNAPVISAGAQSDMGMAGQGSQLGLMSRALAQVNDIVETWLLPLADDPAAVSATGSITFNGTPTGYGTLSIYIAGQLVPMLVTAGLASTAIATSFAALVNITSDLPVVATVSGSTVTLSSKNAGLLGNDIDIRMNYLGAAAGERLPTGMTAPTIVTMNNGSQNPTALVTALANLASQPFDFIICPYSDAASLNAIQSFLAARWSPVQEIFGHAFTAFRGTFAQRTTFLTSRNDPHVSVLPFQDSPSPVWAIAAWFGGVCALSALQDPALPVTGYAIPMLAPPVASQNVFGMQQTTLLDGGSIFDVVAGQVIIKRVTTTYTVNPTTGAPDNSYKNVETLTTATAVTRDFRINLSNQFERCKLVTDDTPLAGGSKTVTSKVILAAAKAIYRTQVLIKGWCQDPDGFDAVALSQNAGNGLVKLLLPVRFAGQLRVIAGSIQFTTP